MVDLEQMKDPLGLARVGYAAPLLEHRAIRYTAAGADETVERIADEVPVSFVYNGQPHVVMMATPQYLEDFALGFSFTEELVAGAADITHVEVVRFSQGIELQIDVAPARMEVITARTRRLTGRTGCGICGAESFAAVMKQLHAVGDGTSVSLDAVRLALESLQSQQPLNAQSGAVHAAGWSTRDGVLDLVREDVGRHNALDKLIGALLTRGTDPLSGFVVVTSRASFEMVQKTTAFGAPILAAISGPTGLAVRVAEQSGLTLIGFARGDRYTVYTWRQRVRG